MSRLFLYIYDYFEKHRVAFFAILFSLVAVLAVMASQVRFQENITNFFNSSSEEKNSTFENLAVKDKIIVLISGEDPDEIISSAEIFEEQIEALKQENLVSAVTATADEQTIGSVISFVYKYLPIFLTDEDYKALEEKTTTESIDNQIGNVYNILTSPSGMIIGDVVMGDDCSIWYGTVLRGDVNSIRIGNKVNIQDGAVIHTLYQRSQTIIGDNVSIGHNAVVHGATIEDNCLIGMGAIVLDNAVVESGAIVAAGALVTSGMRVEGGHIYAGVPAKKIKAVDEKQRDEIIKRIADDYVMYASWYK